MTADLCCFSEDSLLVIMNEGIREQNACGPCFFDEIPASSVEALFQYPQPGKKYLNHQSFRQVFRIKLKTRGKNEVLKAAAQLNKRGDFAYAGPNYYGAAATSPYASCPAQHYALSAISVPQAWAITTGSASVRVGVIDSGIFPHRDLVRNITAGWDFVNNNGNTGDDTSGHGTYIAGIIGAAQSQNGVAGVCQNVRIIPLQVMGGNGLFDRAAVIKAIAYAVDNDIPILNYCDSSDCYDYALEAAIQNYSGLFVCSAGNTGRNIDEIRRYPASLNLENVICVAASDRDDSLCAASNYGAKTVHLAAPGEAIYTTAPGIHPDNAYTYTCGTSVAAPYVTGVAALIKSVVPHSQTQFIKSTLLSTVDQFTQLFGKVSSGGRLNAYRAVNAAYYHAGCLPAPTISPGFCPDT